MPYTMSLRSNFGALLPRDIQLVPDLHNKSLINFLTLAPKGCFKSSLVTQCLSDQMLDPCYQNMPK